LEGNLPAFGQNRFFGATISAVPILGEAANRAKLFGGKDVGPDIRQDIWRS